MATREVVEAKLPCPNCEKINKFMFRADRPDQGSLTCHYCAMIWCYCGQHGPYPCPQPCPHCG